MTQVFDLKRGHSPLIISMPHSGEELGPYASRMTADALKIADTDWHLPALYGFLTGMDATVLHAHYSRYVIDLNRDPSGKSLYPGQNVTELCPTTTFDEQPVYLPGETPHEAEQRDRVDHYWKPYHNALAAEIERVRHIHGYALLWDAHSIRSEVPRFFDGRLPDFNLGTNDGLSCSPDLAEAVFAVAQQAEGYSAILNGRFKGGFITRKYGQPAHGVHAIQLELSQITYMEEVFPYSYLPERARNVAQPIQAMLEAMLDWRPQS
ncbi:N-formylglutamate deformylase [Kordiimonas lipolytica]|uniref:N-formylglutamate deformylase n=1 Tax=Kordiimonas lipolytica TaxID=1662421 RepID=A0ABV8UEU1_9PROT|nr:N-formylglutamate deformylase [Kordiimonas lipolytica]